MKGLLRRLAASATGSAVTLRSDACLPYHGTGFDWADAESSDAAAAGAPVPRSQPVPQARPMRPADTDVGMQQTIEPQQQRADPTREPHLTRVATQLPIELQQRAAPAPLLPGKTARAFGGHASREPAPPWSADAAANPLPDADRADPPTAPIERSTSMPSLVRPAVVEGTPSPFVARDAPTPLLPQARRGMLPLDATAPPQAVAQTTAGQDTEVHVHIGRIDVTAVHEPAPPVHRRATAATRAPMSLDTYLAARNRSGA